MGGQFVPFDLKEDYRRYVDGKPRERPALRHSFKPRGIDLPHGSAADGRNTRTSVGLGNLKEQYFLEHLKAHGVERYDTSIQLVRALRAENIKQVNLFQP